MQETHLVALSGGADSVCLLLLLKDLGYNIHAVHCNFHLRGIESDRDEIFCKKLCTSNNIPFHFTHFDTKGYAELHKVSIEMAARNLRYAYFEQLRQSVKAADIVVAHHKNDNVETLLMNLIRGTGIHGLEAIKPKNGVIIRPLLCVTRNEIEAYLATRKQDFVTDSTNLIPDVVRNKIRIEAIPLLEKINPAAQENISKTINYISEAVKIVDYYTKRSIDDCCKKIGTMYVIDKSLLQKQPSVEYVLFSILSPMGFTPAQISQINNNINVQSGRVWESSTHTIVTDRNALLIESNEKLKASPSLIIPECGIYLYNGSKKLDVSISRRTDDFIPSKNNLLATIDSDKVTFPLTLRSVRQADRFTPFGMKGTKLVSDYLTDKKCNYFQRKQQLLVEDANGNIIWLIGERTSQKVACTSQTINVLILRYIINEK